MNHFDKLHFICFNDQTLEIRHDLKVCGWDVKEIEINVF